ncbi:hypothetical protein OSTOST_14699 [Ostertagia ostertagi]
MKFRFPAMAAKASADATASKAFGSDGTGPTYIEIIVDCTIGFLVIIIFVVLFATIVVRRRREEASRNESNKKSEKVPSSPAHGADVSPHKDTDGPARKGSDNRPREDHTPDSRPREDSTLPDTRPREDSTPPDAAKPDGGGGGAGAPLTAVGWMREIADIGQPTA